LDFWSVDKKISDVRLELLVLNNILQGKKRKIEVDKKSLESVITLLSSDLIQRCQIQN
jgi:hypothetical protein